MKTGSRDRGGNIDYPTTQNMIQALKRNTDKAIEDLVEPEPACLELHTDNEFEVDTGMTQVYAVEGLNELIYVFGLLSGTPTMRTYRQLENGMTLIKSLTLTQALRRTSMQGSYIYGCNDGAGSNFVFAIDITKPNDPLVVGSIDAGGDALHVFAQGHYLYVCVADVGIVVVRIVTPGNMTIVGTAI